LFKECEEYATFYQAQHLEEQNGAIQRQMTEESAYELDEVDVDRLAADKVTSVWNTVLNTTDVLPPSIEACPLTKSKLAEMRNGIDRLLNAGPATPAGALNGGASARVGMVDNSFLGDSFHAEALAVSSLTKVDTAKAAAYVAARRWIGTIRRTSTDSGGAFSPSGGGTSVPNSPLQLGVLSPRRPKRSVSLASDAAL
jgi:hypothetical protein